MRPSVSRHVLVQAAIMLAVMACVPLAAQSQPAAAKPADAKPAVSELESLRDELNRIKERLDRADRLEILRARALRVYGDIGLRWQGVFTDGESRNNLPGGQEINRPEYRVRLGIAGYLYDTEKHRFKYDLRLATRSLDEYASPVRSVSQGWRAVDAFGTSGEAEVDRWQAHHTYKDYLRVGGGKFGSVFEGTELIYDHDVGLPGVFTVFDAGSALNMYGRKPLDSMLDPDPDGSLIARLQLRGACYYLAQNNIGFPVTVANAMPHAFSIQAILKARLAATDFSIMLAPGFHYVEGEEALLANSGTGTTSGPTNTTDAGGIARAGFRVADLYFSTVLWEHRIASLKFYAHIARNFAADIPPGFREREALGLVSGIEWGALQLERQGDFRFGYAFVYVQADTTAAPLNSEVFNTNYTGHQVTAEVAVMSGMHVFGSMNYGRRENDAFGGMGRRPDGFAGNPGHDHETRWRVGVVVRF